VIPNRFHVQVGAFTERQNADALGLRLRAMGYAVKVTDGPPYRVWVGAYLDQATAERLAETIRAAGFDAVLTPR
jgi:cell division protein FtsN